MRIRILFVYVLPSIYEISLIYKYEGIEAQNSRIRGETQVVETKVVDAHIVAKVSIIEQNTTTKGPPEFNVEQKLLVVDTWHYVQDHVSEVMSLRNLT